MSDEQSAVQDSTATEMAATPETVATPTPETEAAQGEQTQAEKSFSQSELNEIIQKEKAKAEARAERRALKVYADKLEAMHQKPPEHPQEQRSDGQPKIEQFNTVEEFLDARDQWRDNFRAQQSQQQQQATQNQGKSTKAVDVYKAAEKIPGFNREEFDSLPISGVVADAILESEVAAKLMAHLSSNPAEATRIYNLSPVRQAAEIGRLEARLALAPKTSNAPEPITPIGGKSGASTKTIFDDNLSQSEFDKLRRSQKGRK